MKKFKPTILQRAVVSTNKCSRNCLNHNPYSQNYSQIHRKYTRYAAQSWIFDKTRCTTSASHDVIIIGGGRHEFFGKYFPILPNIIAYSFKNKNLTKLYTRIFTVLKPSELGIKT